jgi:murein DD-endopeptidase MepM/ murein hydrolase activator NlpD
VKFLFRSGFGCACLLALAFTTTSRYQAESRLAEEIEVARSTEAMIAAGAIRVSEHTVPRGRSFYDTLVQTGVDTMTAVKVIQAVQPVFDLRRVRAGNGLALVRAAGEVRALRYDIDTDRALWVLPREERFEAEIKQIPSISETIGVSGMVQSSLFQAVDDAGESPEITMRLADIFGWDIDFNTDPRQGDTFRLVVEKKTYPSTGNVSYGRILAAEYVNGGKAFQAVLFRDPQGNPAYYGADGKSLKKAFLKSPLMFNARISSGFSHRRFHPVLKRYRPHLGVDYAAPAGTPVQAIGAGKVIFAGYKGGGGKTVEIRHANGFTTYYLHLSRIYVRTGQSVRQGERIGAVGATGLATGPHLDFRIKQNGLFRNFAALRLPPAEPVARRDWDDFVAQRDQALAMMPGDVKLAQRDPRQSASN